MAYLILVRHGQSLWNAKGLWTGLQDIVLSTMGHEEAKQAAHALEDIPIDIGFTSPLKRAKETLADIKHELHLLDLPTYENKALDERDYGDYTGKNKWELKQQLGDEEFKKLRRSWDEPIPNGETLKDVYNRVVPYYTTHILPFLKNGKNVIIAAHGNSLRALIKYLEHISDENVTNLEIGTGEIRLYSIDEQGNIIHKEKRATNPNVV